MNPIIRLPNKKIGVFKMKNVMVIVSGMPATGKTSFASWLSSNLCAPMVCYDHIKERTLKTMYASCKDPEQYVLFNNVMFDFFWFNVEEIMKSSSLLIVEYFFKDDPILMEPLNSLVEKYQYETINVHMDSSIETAHRRFHQRSPGDSAVEGMRPKEIPYEKFAEGVKPNKDFRYGSRVIYVDTEDFASVSYEGVAEQIKGRICDVIG